MFVYDYIQIELKIQKKKKKLYAVIPPCNHCYKYKMGIKHPGFGVIMLEAHSLLP